MDKRCSSSTLPFKELWKTGLIGQTIDAKLESIYKGLGEIQKLVISRTKDEDEQRIVRRRVRFNPSIDPTKPGYPSITCLLYTSPSPRDGLLSRMPSSA